MSVFMMTLIYEEEVGGASQSNTGCQITIYHTIYQAVKKVLLNWRPEQPS